MKIKLINVSTWLLFIVYRLLALLPLAVLRFCGARLGRGLYKVLSSRKKVAKINIDACFSELDDDQKEALVKSHFERMGQGLLDISFASWASKSRLRSALDIEGQEYISEALDRGKSVILIVPHFVDAQAAVFCVSSYFPLMVMYKTTT